VGAREETSARKARNATNHDLRKGARQTGLQTRRKRRACTMLRGASSQLILTITPKPNVCTRLRTNLQIPETAGIKLSSLTRQRQISGVYHSQWLPAQIHQNRVYTQRESTQRAACSRSIQINISCFGLPDAGSPNGEGLGTQNIPSNARTGNGEVARLDASCGKAGRWSEDFRCQRTVRGRNCLGCDAASSS
jgi:hypothetical protein